MAILALGGLGCSSGSSPSAQANWVAGQGGLRACTASADRLQLACGPMLATAGIEVRLHVIASDRPGAWSWPSGDVYVSEALLPLLTDTELAAVVGHEIGHLLRDGHLHTRLALASTAADASTEADADAVACSLLRACRQDARAMRTALQKLSAHPSTSPALRTALAQRIRRLH